jgi:hypothetical protein
MISEPMERSAQNVHLPCAETNTFSKWTENNLSLDLHHLGVPSGLPKAISMPVVHLAQTMHLSYAEIKTISKWIEMSFCLIHVT